MKHYGAHELNVKVLSVSQCGTKLRFILKYLYLFFFNETPNGYSDNVSKALGGLENLEKCLHVNNDDKVRICTAACASLSIAECDLPKTRNII